MKQKPPAANAPSKASRRLRIAMLLGLTGVASTAALLAGLEPKLPPYSGD